MGLLVAFTFSGAASRFASRRDLIVKEANNIGTANLRIDLLPFDAQLELRNDFRSYLDALWHFGLASTLLSGYGMAKAKTRNLLHMVIYPVILATAVLHP
jgi:hypothetical protein